MKLVKRGSTMNKPISISLVAGLLSTVISAAALAEMPKPGQGFVPPPPGPYQPQSQQRQPPQPPARPDWAQRPQPPQPPARPNWAQRPPYPQQQMPRWGYPPAWAQQPPPAPLKQEQAEK